MGNQEAQAVRGLVILVVEVVLALVDHPVAEEEMEVELLHRAIKRWYEDIVEEEIGGLW
jgi:hypothetical protein